MDEAKLKIELEQLIEKWKDRKGSLIMILHEIQNHYGFVPRQASFHISKGLNVPMAKIYEVITFYHFFKLTPPGKHQIAVCMGTACYLKGAAELLQEFETRLHIKARQLTEDGQFQLEVVRCLGCCGLAPVVKIDQKIYSKVTLEEIKEILSHYTNQAKK